MTKPMTNEDVRRENARKLAEKCGGPTVFADIANIAPPRVTHIIGPNPTRNIGRATARRIEKAFDLPIGWLDIPNAWATYGDNTVSDRTGSESESGAMARDIKEFIDTYYEVPAELRGMLMDSVRAIRRGSSALTTKNEV